jgi:hypothetical protein
MLAEKLIENLSSSYSLKRHQELIMPLSSPSSPSKSKYSSSLNNSLPHKKPRSSSLGSPPTSTISIAIDNSSVSSNQNYPIEFKTKRSNSWSNLSYTSDGISEWRDRLWPSKALLWFYRAITYCSVTQNPTAGDKNKYNIIRSWWNSKEFEEKTYNSTFASYSTYVNYFMMSICEECIFPSFKSEDLKWSPCTRDIEVLRILSESEYEAASRYSETSQASSHSDAGSVWIIQVAILQSNKAEDFKKSFWTNDLITISNPFSDK